MAKIAIETSLLTELWAQLPQPMHSNISSADSSSFFSSALAVAEDAEAFFKLGCLGFELGSTPPFSGATLFFLRRFCCLNV